MKTVIALLSLLSSAAMAFPNIGDSATYNFNVKSGGAGEFGGQLVQELMAFDATAKQYTIKRTVYSEGQAVNEETSQVPEDQVPTKDMIDNLVANCAAAGGTLETVTVVAGTFDTCKIASAQEQIWIAAVPFAMVKYYSIDQEQNETTAELASFVTK